MSLPPGTYGLSNSSLDTPWPKLIRSRDALQAIVDADEADETSLLRVLEDRTPAPIADVESGDLPFIVERARTAPFIVGPEYGTRCTTALLWSLSGEITISERRFNARGEATGESRFRFRSGDQSLA